MPGIPVRRIVLVQVGTSIPGVHVRVPRPVGRRISDGSRLIRTRSRNREGGHWFVYFIPL
ncbi:MAG: hypothetical protein V1908_01955 [Candidatus Peregrinibacteria bacterium]